MDKEKQISTSSSKNENLPIEDTQMVDNTILNEINKFYNELRSGKDCKREIRKFFYSQPKASDILRRQIMRPHNHEILLMHRIINRKLDTTLLLSSLAGINLCERNCALLYEMYFYRLVTDFDKVQEKFAILPNSGWLLRKAEEIAQFRIIEKDWEVFEQKKYSVCVIKERIQDIARMTQQRDKQSLFLNRQKIRPDFLLVIDIDSIFFKDDLLNFSKEQISNLKLPDSAEIKSAIQIANIKLEKIVQSLPLFNTSVMIIQKKHEKLNNLYKLSVLENLNIFRYENFNYKLELQKYGKKRCFVLKSNCRYERKRLDLAYVNLDRICEFFFIEDVF
ncbi:hypothetical protein M153_2630009281 [Pseudoloma neurophilia]|uniref:Uncharacterized protein n=1 Tax=Pseudoloma neurophilia TaxID=146866 RepID=A0A0R0M4C7_9MICR|nr:hypothetical protein M153_2630009281 [Pseudoloma neurophilia]